MEKLPDFLKLSPEQIAANEGADEVLRSKLATRIKMSPFEYERARALTLEDEQRRVVESLSSVVKLGNKLGAAGNVEAKSQLDISRRQLAESLASQGKYLDAAKQTSDAEEKKLYRKMDKAVWTDDENICKCAAPVDFVNGEKWTLPKYRIVRRVYSLKHEAEMPLLECVVCGKWNARNLTLDLQRIEAAIAKGGKPVSDAEIFKDK